MRARTCSPARTPIYQDDVVVGSSKPAGTGSHYDTSAPLYREIKALSALRAANPALADGAQVHRYASDAAGIYAISRIDKAAKREYVVVANNATTAKTATFSTYSAGSKLVPLLGATSDLRAAADGRVTVTVPPLSVAVYRANSTMAQPKSAPAIYPTSPSAGGVVGGRAEIGAALPGNTFAEVTFLQRPVGTSAWTPIGTDDNAPYRVFHDVSGLAKGTLVEYRMVAKDVAGHVSATSTYGIVGEPDDVRRRWRRWRRPGHPARQRQRPRQRQLRDGLPRRLAAGLRAGAAGPRPQGRHLEGHLRLDPGRRLRVQGRDRQVVGRELRRRWRSRAAATSPTPRPAASPSPSTTTTARTGSPTTRRARSSRRPAASRASSAAPETGRPDCMRSWLQDPDGDGTYVFTTDQIPAATTSSRSPHGLTGT